MAPFLELLFLTIALICGTIAIVRWQLVRAARLPHLHEVEARFACPKTASDVDCVLVDDTETGQYLGVKTCSRFGKNGTPQCEQHCVKLINLGVALRPKGDAPALEPSPEAPIDGAEEMLHER